MTEQLVPYQGQDLALTREPEIVMQEATRAAQALTRVLAAKPKRVILNNEQYLEFEDWQLLGKFYGLTTKVVETRYITFGNVRGWEAHAIVIDRTGREVSAADAMCLNDEEKWSARPKYEWFHVLKDGTKQRDTPPRSKIIWVENPKSPGKKIPKRERVKVGEEPVPFFQLRSMAQTRAASKALRNVLSWVVVLAGYKPISAEDIEGPDFPEEEPGSPGGPATGQAGNQSSAPSGQEEALTREQEETILSQLRKKNLALEHLEGYLGMELAKFTRSILNPALEWIARQKPEP